MHSISGLLLTAMLLIGAGAGAESPREWKQLAPGMELGEFPTKIQSPVGDSRITILRIDPDLWELVVIGKSWDENSSNQTARSWCETHELTAAINAGMFADDYSTHIGYLAGAGHVNNGHVNHYKSVAAFSPSKGKDLNGKQLPAFRIFDLDHTGVAMDTVLTDFTSVLQNLRLIKRPGENRWSQQDKRWSEAALGEDASGRVLFIFCRSPFTMHDLNEELLGLKIGVVAAQHLEGGPEAQLYLRLDNVEKELFGSYETSFRENDGNAEAWEIPNVIGVRSRR